MTTNIGQSLRSWVTQTVPHSAIPHIYRNGRDSTNWTAATATMEGWQSMPVEFLRRKHSLLLSNQHHNDGTVWH
jgi:hypothetical protein